MMTPSTLSAARKLLYIFVVHCFLIAGLAEAQAQKPDLRTESNVVNVPTLVLDQNGKPVFGLRAADFAIEDNGKTQNVALDETAEPPPFSIVIAVQTGRSAKSEFSRMAGFNALLEPIMAHGNARISLVTFDSEVTQLKGFTTEIGDLSPMLTKLRPGDQGAAILSAIRYSVTLLEHEPLQRQRILLLISETRDHGSQGVDLDEAVRVIQSSNTLVYALAFGPALSSVLDDLRGKLEPESDHVDPVQFAVKMAELGRQGMRKNVAKTAAHLTGGEYELFKSGNGFQNYLNAFTNHLYSRYVLYFTPEEPQPGLHPLRVRMRNSQTLTVISRPTYWARGRPN